MEPAQVLRVKYREKPVAVSSKNSKKITPRESLSTYKKVPKIEKLELDDDGYGRFEAAPFYYKYTQNASSNTIVFSNESEFRDINNPSLAIKLREHGAHVKRKEKEEALSALLQANQDKWDNVLNNPVSFD